MKNSEILIAARAKIEKPEHWTQGAFARDSEGHKTRLPSSTLAVCYCSVGALLSIGAEYGNTFHYLDRVIEDTDLEIEEFNDSHTHQEVLEMFDKAILLAEAEEGTKCQS